MKFKHNRDALFDERCLRLLGSLGYAGYGLYWALIETLLQIPEREAPISAIPQFARRFRVRSKTLSRVVNDFDLFEISEDGSTFRSNQKSSVYLNP